MPPETPETLEALQKMLPAYIERDEGIEDAKVRKTATGWVLLTRFNGTLEFREEYQTPNWEHMRQMLLLDAGGQQPDLDDKDLGPGVPLNDLPDDDQTPVEGEEDDED